MKWNFSFKHQIRDLIIISMRFLLAFVFLSYGIAKLTNNQFGNLTIEELNTPIKELSLFKVSWYLFDHQPFKFFTGICEIIAAILLLFKRTAILGTLILIPIILNVLVIDIMIMPPSLKIDFIFRLSFYLIFCGLILYDNRKELINVWKIIISKKEFNKHNYWKYFLIPIFMVMLEIISAIFKLIYFTIAYPNYDFNYIKNLF